MNFDCKRVNDPVHGSIHLSKLECDIISTSVFQRLHNVKQLGLGVVVYPGANYSRFSHSLGACHLAGRMINAIDRNSSANIADKERQLYRLGGLLHDIGHYPFSHAFEHALDDYYGGGDVVTRSNGLHYDHEQMGREIIRYSPEIGDVLKKHDFTVEEVVKVFSSGKISGYKAILSSDLDCDRLDYLMRTAHHAGLPFGRIDLNHLVNNTTVDDEERVCLNHKALRSADHLLLSRFYDYAQLPFHKKVAAMEISLRKVVMHLLESGDLECSREDMKSDIENNKWQNFDDQHLVSKMREELAKNSCPPDVSANIKAILERKPPKMVFSQEEILSSGEKEMFFQTENILKGKIKDWAMEFDIPENCWSVTRNDFKFTRFGTDDFEEDETDPAEQFQLVRIKGVDNNSVTTSKPLIACKNTIISQLSNQRYVDVRLFVLIPSDKKAQKSEIKKKIRSDVLSLGRQIT